MDVSQTMNRTFAPKYTTYHGDGYGRDTYITTANGGLISGGAHTRNGPTTGYQVSPGLDKFYINQNIHQTRHSGGKNATCFKYFGDGTGRDSYVTADSGGLIPKYFGKGTQQNFLNGLRQPEPSRYTGCVAQQMRGQKHYSTNGRGQQVLNRSMVWQSDNVRQAMRYTHQVQKQQSLRLSTPKSQRSRYGGGPQQDFDFNNSLIVTGQASQSTRNSVMESRKLRNSSQNTIQRAVTNTQKKRAFFSQHVSPDRSIVVTPVLISDKKQSPFKKPDQVLLTKTEPEEAKKQSPKADENNYEDCNDLVLVENNDEEKVEKSVSPSARDRLVDYIRPGTSPVVQRVPKGQFNKIGAQIREYKQKLVELRKSIPEMDNNSSNQGSAERVKIAVDQSFVKNSPEFKKFAEKNRSSHDATQFTHATGNYLASSMDQGRYKKLLSSSAQFEINNNQSNDKASRGSQNRRSFVTSPKLQASIDLTNKKDGSALWESLNNFDVAKGVKTVVRLEQLKEERSNRVGSQAARSNSNRIKVEDGADIEGLKRKLVKKAQSSVQQGTRRNLQEMISYFKSNPQQRGKEQSNAFANAQLPAHLMASSQNSQNIAPPEQQSHRSGLSALSATQMLMVNNQCSQTARLDLLKKQYMHELQKRGNKLNLMASMQLNQRGLKPAIRSKTDRPTVLDVTEQRNPL